MRLVTDTNKISNVGVGGWREKVNLTPGQLRVEPGHQTIAFFKLDLQKLKTSQDAFHQMSCRMSSRLRARWREHGGWLLPPPWHHLLWHHNE